MSIIQPGWSADTAIGNGIVEWMTKNKPELSSTPVETLSEACIEVVNSLTLEDNGQFFNYDGSKLPW
jgi:hypothetical protein